MNELEFRLSDYAPIAVMFMVAGGFAASQILATQLVGPKKRTKTKLSPYECGKDPVGSARERFSVKFYSVAVDFLLFDLEVLFLIPFAVAFRELMTSGFREFGVPAYVAVMTFIAMVIIGFAYAWKKGTFDWSVQARAEARAEAKTLAVEEKQKRRLSTTTGKVVAPVSVATQATIPATSRV
ncbi:MAG: NADH-quinone oxidoreductase subunit A [Pyrinomonadaceae bacterium]|nr:NADH-quinone oxidoreductase subunit A [Pyrinomonadaceae bacterium]